jgi:hypothetical protein
LQIWVPVQNYSKNEFFYRLPHMPLVINSIHANDGEKTHE